MKPNTWLAQFDALKARGVSPLSDEERKLRRLPIEAVRTLEAVFQPRQLEDAAASGKHLGELLRVLRDHDSLDPITVMRIGGEWFCIDGHHRLEAYRQAGGRKTHIPVKVYSGSLEEALQLSVAVNAPDKLNMSKYDKLEAAWRLVILNETSAAQIAKVTTVSERSVQRMRRGLEKVRGLHPSVAFEEWTWATVKRLLLNGDLKESPQDWQTGKAREWSRLLAKTFCGLPLQHPGVFAQALLRYNPEAAKVIAEEVLRVRDVAVSLRSPDF